MSQDSPDTLAEAVLESETPTERPTLTWLFAAANIVVYLLMAFASPQPFNQAIMDMDPATLLRWGAKFGPFVWQGEYWRVLTAVFLHGGLIHLFFNTWALLNIGPAVEYLYGHAKFALIYLGAGILGNAVSLAFSDTLSIGASGAIFGIFGGLVYLAMRMPGREARRLWVQLSIPLGYNVVYGFASPNIDNFAHLGGLAGGIALSYALGLSFAWETPRTASAARQLTGAVVIVALALVVVASIRQPHEWYTHFQLGNRYFQAGDFGQAAREYGEAAHLNYRVPEIQFNLALSYVRLGNYDLARAALQKALTLSPGFRDARELLRQLEAVHGFRQPSPGWTEGQLPHQAPGVLASRALDVAV